MPYEITWTENRVEWHYSGVLTGRELLQSNLDIFGDEGFDDLEYQIVYLNEVESIEVTEKHMRKVAYLDMAAARSNPKIKIAVVANSASGRLLNEYYDKYSAEQSPWTTKLFKTLEEARAWTEKA